MTPSAQTYLTDARHIMAGSPAGYAKLIGLERAAKSLAIPARHGVLLKVDAVDALYTWAEADGLIADVGQDVVEQTIGRGLTDFSEPEAAKSDKEPTFKTFTPQLWHGQPVPQREWCVEGFIPQANVTMLMGDGGLGKTLLAMQLQVAGAVGKPWLGVQMEPIKSLGFYCEDDTPELHRRMVDIGAHYGHGLDTLGTVNLVSRVGEENILVQFGKNDIGQATPLYNELTKRRRCSCNASIGWWPKGDTSRRLSTATTMHPGHLCGCRRQRASARTSSSAPWINYLPKVKFASATT